MEHATESDRRRHTAVELAAAMLTVLLLFLLPGIADAEQAKKCPASTAIDSAQTMALLQASRAYFDIEEADLDKALTTELTRDPSIAEEMAAILAAAADHQALRAGMVSARLYPERAPALLAAILTSRDWLDYEGNAALTGELVTGMSREAAESADALTAIGVELGDLETPAAPDTASSGSANIACALERGSNAANHVLTVLGK